MAGSLKHAKELRGLKTESRVPAETRPWPGQPRLRWQSCPWIQTSKPRLRPPARVLSSQTLQQGKHGLLTCWRVVIFGAAS